MKVLQPLLFFSAYCSANYLRTPKPQIQFLTDDMIKSNHQIIEIEKLEIKTMMEEDLETVSVPEPTRLRVN